MITASTHKEVICDFGKWAKCMGADKRTQASHVSLFTALFVFWQQAGFISPFKITRKAVMVFSKTTSIATYHKCIRELETFGYIRYQPSYHPKLGSLVWLPKTASIINNKHDQIHAKTIAQTTGKLQKRHQKNNQEHA